MEQLSAVSRGAQGRQRMGSNKNVVGIGATPPFQVNVRIDQSGKKRPRSQRNPRGSLGHLNLRRRPGGGDALPVYDNDCGLNRRATPRVNHAFGFYRDNIIIHVFGGRL
jgi:hypothetical protein